MNKTKKSYKNKHEIVIIQKLVKQNQKNIVKITKKGYKNQYKTVAEIFLMKKRTKKNRI